MSNAKVQKKHGMQIIPLDSHILPDNDFKPANKCLLCEATAETEHLTPTPHKTAMGWKWISQRGRFLCPKCFARYNVTITAYNKMQDKSFKELVSKWSSGVKI